MRGARGRADRVGISRCCLVTLLAYRGTLAWTFLASGATAARANDPASLRPLGELALKGKTAEVEVYTLAGDDSVTG